jgi:DNA polymerase III delta prime subunit
VRDVRAEVRAIRERMKRGGHPLVILVSGVHGIGKTTLSHEVSRRLGVHQCVGLGTIVKTLIEFDVPSDTPGGTGTMDNVVDLEDPAAQLDAQARVICRVVDRLVRTYHAQGVHCLVEGVQLLPKYLHLPEGAIHLHLAISGFDAYIRQVRDVNPHKYGPITEPRISTLAALDRVLSREMQEAQEVVVLPHQRPVGGVVAEAIRVVHERYVQGGGSDLCSGNE